MHSWAEQCWGIPLDSMLASMAHFFPFQQNAASTSESKHAILYWLTQRGLSKTPAGWVWVQPRICSYLPKCWTLMFPIIMHGYAAHCLAIIHSRLLAVCGQSQLGCQDRLLNGTNTSPASSPADTFLSYTCPSHLLLACIGSCSSVRPAMM